MKLSQFTTYTQKFRIPLLLTIVLLWGVICGWLSPGMSCCAEPLSTTELEKKLPPCCIKPLAVLEQQDPVGITGFNPGVALLPQTLWNGWQANLIPSEEITSRLSQQFQANQANRYLELRRLLN